MICVPLITGGNCIGCLEFANKKYGEFTDQDFRLINLVANEITTGLNVQKNKTLIGGFRDEQEEFKEKVGQIANENLLTPLLKNILILLAGIINCEK